MYAQLSTGQTARAQYVVGVPPRSCLTVVSQVFFLVVLVILLLCCCAVLAQFPVSIDSFGCDDFSTNGFHV